MMSEVVLDGGWRFSPAGIVGVHTLPLLLSSRPAHERATGNTIDTKEHTHEPTNTTGNTIDTKEHTHEPTNTWVQ